jgi:poly-gamma-glutamate synthesis protein (capsule biosynthesis protein)
MALVAARALAARNPLSRQVGGRSGWPARAAAGFLVGLLALATGSCSAERASGSPAGAATHPPASGATRAPAATTAPPASFTIVASGDVLPHSSLVARAKGYGARTGRAYDFRPMLSAIKPIVSRADLAVCHMETPLSPTGRHLSGYPVFLGPPQVATAVRDAGYDACSAASNHSLDQGPRGITGTLEVLDRAGLHHAGIARNPREAQPTMLDVKGARVAMLSYAYGFNGRKVPAGQPWRANRIDPARILADARAARRAGSQFTVVFLHWGQEYRTAPTPQQRSVAQRLLADPSVDLILGHHVHVVQPAERIDGKWVAFGMGNLLSAQTPACCPPNTQDGVIMHATVVRSGNRYVVGQLNYVPTWVQHPSFRVLPVLQTLAHPGLDPATRSALAISLRRTRAAMGPQVRPLAR